MTRRRWDFIPLSTGLLDKLFVVLPTMISLVGMACFYENGERLSLVENLTVENEVPASPHRQSRPPRKRKWKIFVNQGNI
jgi:hypothetical protein